MDGVKVVLKEGKVIKWWDSLTILGKFNNIKNWVGHKKNRKEAGGTERILLYILILMSFYINWLILCASRKCHIFMIFGHTWQPVSYY